MFKHFPIGEPYLSGNAFLTTNNPTLSWIFPSLDISKHDLCHGLFLLFPSCFWNYWFFLRQRANTPFLSLSILFTLSFLLEISGFSPRQEK
jgi:hypothetical protein